MKYYTIHEMTEILGVTAQTLRNWDKSGKWKPHHTSSNGYPSLHSVANCRASEQIRQKK